MYYPYMPPPPSPMMVPSIVPQPPLSAGMVPTALVPFSQNQVAAYGYYGSSNGAPLSSRPALERCEGCHGRGVGLVEKNGFCNHCNRLRLDFIVASARMRQRCSVCGGWGLDLVQANGKCDHCTHGYASMTNAPATLMLRRQSTGRMHLSGAKATPIASIMKQPSVKKVTVADDAKLRDVEWDESSSDGSDWDE
uniref:Uncharacterized protein n=1 Tax=Globisporangium ultimum (strain ATCC 200006 / CBS 805.95 / DAOM BR144) TaxID=431595 RepID=K3WFB8_GLOUD